MKESTGPQARASTEERILSTASAQFAAFGYNGASTRDIAAGAGVNEVTIYRHYPRKRNLYLAVLEAELGKANLRGDLLARVAEATNAREALTRVAEVIHITLSGNRDLLRLLHYGSLELGEDLDPMLRRHLGEQIKVLAHYLEPWVARGELRGSNPEALVLTFVAIVLMKHPLARIFRPGGANAEAMFDAYTELCLI